MSLSQLDDDLIFLRGRIADRERELAAVHEAAADAAEAAAWRLQAAQREAAALRRALDEAHALANAAPEAATEELAAVMVVDAAPPPPAPSFPAPSLPVAVRGRSRRSLRRVVALPVWRLVRPVARPMLWRARSFLAADALRELATLRAAQEAMQEATRDAVREAVQEALSAAALPSRRDMEEAPCRISSPSHGLGLGDTAAERWLVTVALEYGRG